MATILGCLGEGRELGIEAKVCELSDQALGPHVLGAAIEMVGTEILELRAVLRRWGTTRKRTSARVASGISEQA
jgi:hypothetical protein